MIKYIIIIKNKIYLCSIEKRFKDDHLYKKINQHIRLHVSPENDEEKTQPGPLLASWGPRANEDWGPLFDKLRSKKLYGQSLKVNLCFYGFFIDQIHATKILAFEFKITEK